MRSHLPSYELKTPKSLHETLGLLSEQPGVWRPFAGGTDIMVLFEAGKLAHKKFLNILPLQELKGIEVTEAHIILGALVTYAKLQANGLLQRELPLLCRAASETGAVAIQNRGTIGGNIMNASPAADSPPALLVYDTEVELISKSGERWVPYATFHTGYKKTSARPDELLRRVRIARNTSGAHQYYRKVGTRKAQAISKVCFAGWARPVAAGLVTDVRIAVGSVAPTALRCTQTEQLLKGQAITPKLIQAARSSIAAEISPIDDIRSTAAFRTLVTQNLLEEFLCGIGSQN